MVKCIVYINSVVLELVVKYLVQLNVVVFVDSFFPLYILLETLFPLLTVAPIYVEISFIVPSGPFMQKL